MSNRKFKAFIIVVFVLFALAIITIIKEPLTWQALGGAFVAGFVTIGTTYFTLNFANAAQRSKYFRPELQEGKKDENK